MQPETYCTVRQKPLSLPFLQSSLGVEWEVGSGWKVLEKIIPSKKKKKSLNNKEFPITDALICYRESLYAISKRNLAF